MMQKLRGALTEMKFNLCPNRDVFVLCYIVFRRTEEISGICFVFEHSYSGKAKVSDVDVGFFLLRQQLNCGCKPLDSANSVDLKSKIS